MNFFQLKKACAKAKAKYMADKSNKNAKKEWKAAKKAFQAAKAANETTGELITDNSTDKTDKVAKKVFNLAKKALAAAQEAAAQEAAAQEAAAQEAAAQEAVAPEAAAPEAAAPEAAAPEADEEMVTNNDEKAEIKSEENNKKSNVILEKLSGEEKENRIFIGNLDRSVNEEHVKDFLKNCGKIVDFYWPTYKSGSSKGFAYASFENVTGKNKAIKKNGEEFMGKPIKIDHDIKKEKYRFTKKNKKPISKSVKQRNRKRRRKKLREAKKKEVKKEV